MRRFLVLAMLVLLAGLVPGGDALAHGRHYRPYGPVYAHPRPYYSFGFHFGYPYGYPAYGYPWYGYPAYGYPWGAPYGPVYGYPVQPPNIGYVDTDIDPEEAEVFVSGAIAGIADDFDGFPDYLALKPGKRTLVFKHEGYRDLRIPVHVVAGSVVQLRMHMEPLTGSGDDSGSDSD